MIIYLKYLDGSNNLIVWFGEKQFLHSLKQKIQASLKQMEMIFPIQNSEEVGNYFMENYSKIKEFLQALIVNALISEIDLYLKPRLKFRASQFFIDTLLSFLQTSDWTDNLILEEDLSDSS